MERYIDWAEELGVDQVIFRQLMEFDHSTAEGRIPQYCEEQTVQLPPLWEELDKRPGFTLHHTVLGYYYYVEIRLRGSITVASELADLRQIDPQIERFSSRLGTPTAFEMVYHPNGNLCAGWLEDQKIMLEY
jgi:hypothetical protein